MRTCNRRSEKGAELVSLLRDLILTCGDLPWLKFVLSSRADSDVRETMRVPAATQRRITLAEHTAVRMVEMYARQSAAELCKQRRAQWQPKDTRALSQALVGAVGRAKGNFLYASELVKLLGNKSLEAMLTPGLIETLPETLPGLYQAFFQQQFPQKSQRRELRDILSVLGLGTQLPHHQLDVCLRSSTRAYTHTHTQHTHNTYTHGTQTHTCTHTQTYSKAHTDTQAHAHPHSPTQAGRLEQVGRRSAGESGELPAAQIGVLAAQRAVPPRHGPGEPAARGGRLSPPGPGTRAPPASSRAPLHSVDAASKAHSNA